MMTNKQSLRAASWWIRWRDLDWPMPDNRDAILRRADEFAGAGVNTAMVFGAHFRWDYMPFWTQVHDYMAAVREALHERGVALFDHHSAVLVHRYDTVEEYRKVWMHSQPHLPFCPDRTNAASWNYRGRLLNDWRILDISSGKPFFSPGYTAEQFCCNNAEFTASYCEYVQRLIADTGIDGLMCDDTNFPGFDVCGCESCRKRFRGWSGHALPEWGDERFWGNWENPEWIRYCRDRFNSVAEFYHAVRSVLPSGDYPMTACCSSSCSDDNTYSAHDLRDQLGGCNLANLELVGNTPPGPLDSCSAFSARLVPSAVHIGIAREQGFPVLAAGYGFIEDNANALWAMVKALGGNCWFSTLKGRLGLPDRILATLPGDAEPATRAFHFERDNPELFQGEPLARCRVFLSQYTHQQTAFGMMMHGYTRDFADTLNLLLEAGVMPEVVSQIPGTEDSDVPLILASVGGFSECEQTALQAFLAAGGEVLAFGPFRYPGLEVDWPWPTCPDGKLEDCAVAWTKIWGRELPPVKAELVWQEFVPHLAWHPLRLQDSPEFSAELLSRLRGVLPAAAGADVRSATGFFATSFRVSSSCIRLFFVATEYAVELNEELDAMRYHRSRVNLYRAAPPCGQDGKISLELQPGWKLARVILPLNSNPADWDDSGVISLSENAVLVIAELRQTSQ